MPAPNPLHKGAWLLKRQLRTARRPFMLGAVGTTAWALALVASAVVLGWAVDRVVLPAASSGQVEVGATVVVAAAVLGIGLVRGLGVVGRRFGAYMAQYNLQRHDRRLMTRQYLQLPLTWHRRHPTGQLLSNASSDVETSSQIAAPMPIVLGATVLLAVTAVFLVVTDVFLVGIALLVVPALWGMNWYFQGRMREVARHTQKARSRVSEVAHESFDGAVVVKTLGREQDETDRFRVEAEELRDHTIGLGRLRAVFDPGMEAIPNLAILVVLAVGAWRVDQGHLSAGDLVTFAYLFRIVGLPMRAYGWLLVMLPRAVVGFGRIKRVLDERDHMPYGQQRLNGHAGSSLHVDDVTYHHPASAMEDLSDAVAATRELADGEARGVDEVSFEVGAGRTIALVGPTGSGKSTLASLLVRQYDPAHGQVRLDATPLEQLDRDELASEAVLVFQEAFLFDDTIRNNITLGEAISDEEIWRALRLARATGFIESDPDGLDRRVGERGGSLSGGQRQRIALARALVRHPRLLVLDDATSAVDPSVEREILEGLREEAGDITTVIVAYRRASIMLADEVVFIDHGRIQARGTHAELLATVPAYVELVRAYEQVDPARLP